MTPDDGNPRGLDGNRRPPGPRPKQTVWQSRDRPARVGEGRRNLPLRDKPGGNAVGESGAEVVRHHARSNDDVGEGGGDDAVRGSPRGNEGTKADVACGGRTCETHHQPGSLLDRKSKRLN